MTTLAAGLAADGSKSADEAEKKETKERTGGRPEEVKWVEVATALGTPNAVIIAGRLESSGVPTWVRQEAVGVYALAVNVGLLGTAYVMVPEEYYEVAREILSYDFSEEEE